MVWILMQTTWLKIKSNTSRACWTRYGNENNNRQFCLFLHHDCQASFVLSTVTLITYKYNPKNFTSPICVTFNRSSYVFQNFPSTKIARFRVLIKVHSYVQDYASYSWIMLVQNRVHRIFNVTEWCHTDLLCSSLIGWI